jgi:predicted Zn-dependent protease
VEVILTLVCQYRPIYVTQDVKVAIRLNFIVVLLLAVDGKQHFAGVQARADVIQILENVIVRAMTSADNITILTHMATGIGLTVYQRARYLLTFNIQVAIVLRLVATHRNV